MKHPTYCMMIYNVMSCFTTVVIEWSNVTQGDRSDLITFTNQPWHQINCAMTPGAHHFSQSNENRAIRRCLHSFKRRNMTGSCFVAMVTVCWPHLSWTNLWQPLSLHIINCLWFHISSYPVALVHCCTIPCSCFSYLFIANDYANQHRWSSNCRLRNVNWVRLLSSGFTGGGSTSRHYRNIRIELFEGCVPFSEILKVHTVSNRWQLFDFNTTVQPGSL